MENGFIITELRLDGNAKETAQVSFKEGLNVITGPSNTGKSYIFECIYYMLGSSKIPKKIDESKGYSNIYLEIKDCNNQYYTLESDLKGGGYKCYKNKISLLNNSEFRVLKRKHDPENDDTISAFLLSLVGLHQKRIRVNAKGKTRYLSYRDINRFSMIDEERILTKESVIISHYTKETEEKNTLKLIVTGEDDSDIIATISEKEITQRKGKVELLTELIANTEKAILEFDIKSDINVYLNTIEESLKKLGRIHQESNKAYNEAYSKRNLFIKDLSEKESREKVLNELLLRSSILDQQYVTDIERLQATIETAYLFLENRDEKKCPICNSLAPNDIITDEEINRIIISCKNEIQKVNLLRKELKESQCIIDEERKVLMESIVILKGEIQQLAIEMDSTIGNTLTDVIEKIKSLNKRRDEAKEIISLQQRLTSYIQYQNKIRNSIPNSNSVKFASGLTTASMNELSLNIKNILEKCNYPNLTDVHYSEDKNDFVISGADRELAGKGYRAITYSSFIIGLHELLASKEYSLGIPVLDSPLVTYKKPEVGEEGITIDIAMDFYRYLSTNKTVNQVIILENEEPPVDISDSINHIIFTQSNNGRYGFFPKNNVD